MQGFTKDDFEYVMQKSVDHKKDKPVKQEFFDSTKDLYKVHDGARGFRIRCQFITDTDLSTTLDDGTKRESDSVNAQGLQMKRRMEAAYQAYMEAAIEGAVM